MNKTIKKYLALATNMMNMLPDDESQEEGMKIMDRLELAIRRADTSIIGKPRKAPRFKIDPQRKGDR